jgi:DnaA-homolog protein
MNQLLLDLGPAPPPTLDNFIAGDNQAALAAVRRLCAAPVADPPARCLYLWGDAGSGRSHLLRAACDALDGRLLAGASATADDLRAALDVHPSRARWLVCVDDVAATDADVQEALFHALNAMREDPRAAIVVAGDAAPRDLALHPSRDDLRSRLAWGLAFQLQPLDDAAMDAALARRADDTGFALSADVRRYLLTHFTRDLGSLMRMVDALDRYAREQKRVITVPMVRAYLQTSIDFDRLPQAFDHAA